MIIEFASVILSVVCLVFSIINVVVMIVKERNICQIKIKFDEMDVLLLSKEGAIKQFLEVSDVSVDECLKMLYDKINEIYPNSNTKISIKVIKEKNFKHPEDSKVVTWISYPSKDKERANISLYTIKNNTDLHSIYIKNKDFFWVSNLKEFNAFGKYINENRDFLKKWSTSIVCPIKKKQERDIQTGVIGFLCIDSLQEFNNVKKNELVIECIKKTTNKLYEAMLKEDIVCKNISVNE